jgi:hypothetical protein
MAKKATATKLNQVEIFYVQEKSRAGVVATIIAEDIGCDVELVVPHMIESENGKTAMQRAVKSKTDGLGRENGVAIMTPPASQQGDAHRESFTSSRNAGRPSYVSSFKRKE